jgi:hypothetical protein
MKTPLPYLFDIATRHMGLSNVAALGERSARAAAALLALRSQFD